MQTSKIRLGIDFYNFHYYYFVFVTADFELRLAEVFLIL